jgi:tetratricopeptide (TPR) repeat protein
MSSEAEAAASADVCASCGIAATDDVKLKKCACNLVKYCTVNCQKNHRPQHKKMCRKRLAELRDDDLFTLPEKSCFGDCPICCLPLPLDMNKSTMMSCCSKLLCMGCHYANQMRENEAGLQQRCAYCREPFPKSKEEGEKKRMERIKKNDPAALTEMGKIRQGEGDYGTALKYYTKAAQLGDADAHHNLSVMYREGHGVEKDLKKYTFHMEEASIGGHPYARHNLGVHEWNSGRYERARKHFIIATNLECEPSLNNLRRFYAKGHASKEDYTDALRAYQAAVNATKSSDREKAEEAIKNGEANFFRTCEKGLIKDVFINPGRKLGDRR